MCPEEVGGKKWIFFSHTLLEPLGGAVKDCDFYVWIQKGNTFELIKQIIFICISIACVLTVEHLVSTNKQKEEIFTQNVSRKNHFQWQCVYSIVDDDDDSGLN